MPDVTILSSRYNTLRDEVNLILGQSSDTTPTYGYGQEFSTNSVIGSRDVGNIADASKVTAQQYEDLYIDMIRVRSHQVGTSVAIDEFVVGNYEANTTNTDNYLTEWVSSSYDYKIGDIVYYNTYLYECIEDHTSTLTFDISKWNVIAFNLNDNVHYNNTLYRCIQSYTSTGSFDLTKWEVVVDKVEESYILGLESLAANIETDKFLVDTNNLRLTDVPQASSTRSSSEGVWNGTLSHIFTMTFDSELERRHFFNAGGEIRLSASVDYTGSQEKTVDWQNILNAMGSTSFKATETVNNAGVGTGSTIGNYDLTNVYQLVYSRTGGAAYVRNQYNVYAQNLSTTDGTSKIQFKVEFNDLAPNDATYGIDESVSGTFNSNVQTATPDSEITINGTLHPAVSIASDPVGAMIKSLDGAPVSSYAIYPDVTSVDEGGSVPFVINTSNVVTGTTLYWTTKVESGAIAANDFTDSTNSGSFIINSNIASITRTLVADTTTEGIETFRIEIRLDSTSGPVVASSSLITVNDTSQTPPPPGSPPPVSPPVSPPVTSPDPTPSGFEFTVTPTLSDWYWIARSPTIDPGEIFTITATSGSGTVTVQETSRPSDWDVRIDNIIGSNNPANTATKTFSLSQGESVNVDLQAIPKTYKEGSGSFAWVGSNGVTIAKTWTGEWLPPAASFTISPSTVDLNEVYTLSIDRAAPNTGFTTTEYGTLYPSGTPWENNGRVNTGLTTNSSGSYSVSGVHTGEIDYYVVADFDDGTSATSNTLTVRAAAPPEPPTPVFEAPTLSFTPSSGTINDTLYTVSWNDNGAGSVLLRVSAPDGTPFDRFTATGSETSTLGQAGTWTATIQTNGGSASRSVTVSNTPPPPPIPPAPLPPPPPPAPSYSISVSVSVSGSTATGFVSGGIPNTSYNWSLSGPVSNSGSGTTNSGGSDTLSTPLPAGSYTVSVSQSGAGSDSDSFTVS